MTQTNNALAVAVRDADTAHAALLVFCDGSFTVRRGVTQAQVLAAYRACLVATRALSIAYGDDVTAIDCEIIDTDRAIART